MFSFGLNSSTLITAGFLTYFTYSVGESWRPVLVNNIFGVRKKYGYI